MKKVKCQTPKEAYIFDYPIAVELAKTQRDVFWPPDEIKVEKDKHDFKVGMTESEQHGVLESLKLFTHYEIKAGVDYWGDRFMRSFPNPSFQMMASCFSFFEINVHAPFYNKLNEALHINTEDFYMSYKESKVLSERMKFIGSMIHDKDDLISVAAFSMIEGAVLYSSFAFIKHFQSNGKNKILNTVRGINFSVRDEALHCIGGAFAYNQLKSELKAINIPDEYFKDIENKIIKAAYEIYDHECYIIKKFFEKGPMDGITDIQMVRFVESRINICLKQLGIANIFKVTYNPIAEWFYTGINAYQMNDFFTGTGNAYNRAWDESSFIWSIENN